MALFRRTPVHEAVVAEARSRFAELGVETTIRPGAAPEDVQLVASDDLVFPLHNLLVQIADAPRRDRSRLISAHVERMVRTQQEPDPESMPPDELRQRVRTRLLPVGGSTDDTRNFAYARPFTDGVVEALCLDMAETVTTLTTGTVERLALPTDDLYAFGRRNTDAEPIDEDDEVVPGVRLLSGGSLFIASKAANLPAVLGATRAGAVFAIPHRHVLLVAPLDDESAITAIDGLARILVGMLGRGGFPGGMISPDLHHAVGGEVQRVSSIEDGTLRLQVDGPFAAALERVSTEQ